MGRLVIISGPSGAGKSTVVEKLLADCPLPIELSVSATTRPPRSGEEDGRHYHFLSKDEFIRRRDAGEFLEWKEVFGHNCYGTLRATVTAGLSAGKWVLLEIDVEGAMTVREECPDAITIFLHPGSMEELGRRLRSRGTEDDATVARRLEVARREMTFLARYDHEVINRTVEQSVREVCDLLARHAKSETPTENE